MLKKGSLMNLDVAQSAVLPKKHKTEIKAAVADMVVNNAKCSQPSVLPVEKKQLFLSNLLVTNQYIAVSAINHVHAAIGKSLID
ncbi:nucleoside diphosphate kinase [Desulfosporosinus sp. OT]|nr:nucleoside diphosphate kinase [Desulfosporosinus sp. OT]